MSSFHTEGNLRKLINTFKITYSLTSKSAGKGDEAPAVHHTSLKLDLVTFVNLTFRFQTFFKTQTAVEGVGGHQFD